ncbi:hypothetical protein KIW84_057501 [Lathyrus oleraceus]|uniref:Uncharacterized protein n=1 Tax=Pisum sativum TaxID=3888 RepID=A0A9D5AMZ9_PEA|nr:hypothetical protein KIW84_057501 [Pisum sativum]
MIDDILNVEVSTTKNESNIPMHDALTLHDRKKVSENVNEDVYTCVTKDVSKYVSKDVNDNVNKDVNEEEKSVAKWKFIYHRILELERELSDDAQKWSEIKELIRNDQLLKTVIDTWHCYPKLVKEFIVNLTSGFNNAESREYRKVRDRVCCFSLLPTIINEYLGHGILINVDRLPSLKTIAF